MVVGLWARDLLASQSLDQHHRQEH